MANGIEMTEIAFLMTTGIAGAIVAALVRYLEADPGSDPRKPGKFVASLIKGAFAGAAFVFRYQEATELVFWDYLGVFFGSAGFDALVESGTNRVRRSLRLRKRISDK